MNIPQTTNTPSTSTGHQTFCIPVSEQTKQRTPQQDQLLSIQRTDRNTESPNTSPQSLFERLEEALQAGYRIRTLDILIEEISCSSTRQTVALDMLCKDLIKKLDHDKSISFSRQVFEILLTCKALAKNDTILPNIVGLAAYVNKREPRLPHHTKTSKYILTLYGLPNSPLKTTLAASLQGKLDLKRNSEVRKKTISLWEQTLGKADRKHQLPLGLSIATSTEVADAVSSTIALQALGTKIHKVFYVQPEDRHYLYMILEQQICSTDGQTVPNRMIHLALECYRSNHSKEEYKLYLDKLYQAARKACSSISCFFEAERKKLPPPQTDPQPRAKQNNKDWFFIRWLNFTSKPDTLNEDELPTITTA